MGNLGFGWRKEIQEEQRQAVRGEVVGRNAGDGVVRGIMFAGPILGIDILSIQKHKIGASSVRRCI